MKQLLKLIDKSEILNDEKIKYLADNFRKKMSNNILKLTLFGSRARGVNSPGSDYDILIILNKKNMEELNKIRDIEVDFLNKYDILSSSLVYSNEEWQKRINTPLGINIIKDGINL